jgi:hypothetical protein
MKNKIKQDFYLYYQLEDSNFNFLYSIKNCKYPEQTKEYKRLKFWLYQDIIKASGYCTKEYFEDYKNRFSNNGPLYN